MACDKASDGLILRLPKDVIKQIDVVTRSTKASFTTPGRNLLIKWNIFRLALLVNETRIVTNASQQIFSNYLGIYNNSSSPVGVKLLAPDKSKRLAPTYLPSSSVLSIINFE